MGLDRKRLEATLRELHEDAKRLLDDAQTFKDVDARLNSLSVVTGFTFIVSVTSLVLIWRVYTYLMS